MTAALGTGLALVATALGWATPTGTTAAAAAESCPAVQVVWARGSGQGLGDDQYDRFAGQLKSRITGSVTTEVYELGTSEIAGNQYPAVPVGLGSPANSAGAFFSSGDSWDYGNSVNEGVREASAFINAKFEECDSKTRFVLGGFSQGAQVIGETYETLPTNVRDIVVFNALFGDPKLHLPEGEGWNPPACRGENLSAWRRVIGNCDTDNGSLGARSPYLPSGYTNTTGLWCAPKDYVCGTTKLIGQVDGHNYAQEGGDIDAAAIEIAKRLREAMPEAPEDDLDTTVHVIGTGTTGLDVVFVVDSTGSMGGQIAQAKQFAAGMASQVRALRGRVALVEYRDAGDEFVARTLTGLTEDLPKFQDDLASINVGGGGDTPEATLAALMQGFNSLDWRPGATKAAVVLTDAGYHNPDVATGDTTASVAARALEIDPVNVYPVVPQGIESAYSDLAAQTSGKVVINDGDAEAALTEALNAIQTRPVALLALTSYRANPGQTVRFDASASYATEGAIASYSWDFNGDGTFDQTTPGPVVEHVYDAAFDGQMAVKVTDTRGGIASMSAPVLIADELPGPDPSLTFAPTDLTASAGATVAGERPVTVSWKPGPGATADRWAVAVNDVWVGLAEGARNTVTLTDMVASEDAVVRVAGVNAAGEIGEVAEVRVPAEQPTTPAPPPTTPAPPPVTPPTATIPGGGEVKVASDITPGKRPSLLVSGLPAGASAQVRVSTARFDGAFRPWRTPRSLTGLTEGRVRAPALKRGWTACYSVRAVAGAAAGGWSRTVCTARRVPDRKWSTIGATRDGKVTVTTSARSKVKLAGVRDGRVFVFLEKCRECGTVRIMVQGKRLGTVKTMSSSSRPRKMVAALPYRAFERGTLTLSSTSDKPVRIYGLAVVRKSR
jgi:Mg-chelatase subunit ChlD